MISKYLTAFNDEQERVTSSDVLIKFLDENYPKWKTLIDSPTEFLEFFKTDVHVFQNTWLINLANSIFDLVPNINYIESVWNDTNINEFYRYAAIRRLILVESTKYLPIYTNELISGGFLLGGCGFNMISELYDFPNNVKFVVDSNKWTGNNFEFLAQQACEHWNEYPPVLRNKILMERDYFIRKNCNKAMWAMMTIEEKLYLTNAIVANEYAAFHDAVTYAKCLNDRDSSNVVLLTNHFAILWSHIFEDDQPIRHQPLPFDIPDYNIETHEYTPSEQISRFRNLAQDTCNIVSQLLEKAILKLSHGVHPRSHPQISRIGR